MNGENSADEDVREEEEDEDALEFYDKTKSFFDSISCEALEREKGLELSTTQPNLVVFIECLFADSAQGQIGKQSESLTRKHLA